MKFSDIPQFTRAGSWQADFPLADFCERIQRWVSEDGLQLCPDFQRGHVWTTEQQIAYMEFIFRGGKSGRTVYLNWPSWNVPVAPDAYDDFVCVDGLQRITAVQRFIDNEIPVFGHTLSEFEDEPHAMDHYLQVNNNDLKTRREVLQWYLDMNSGGTVHSGDELGRVRQLLEAEQA